jgi:hypothetical protein
MRELLYSFTSGRHTASVHKVGMRDGIPEVEVELRDRQGRSIPLAGRDAEGLLAELQGLSTYTRTLAQEQERRQVAERRPALER